MTEPFSVVKEPQREKCSKYSFLRTFFSHFQAKSSDYSHFEQVTKRDRGFCNFPIFQTLRYFIVKILWQFTVHLSLELVLILARSL